MMFAIYDCGFVPRCALEEDNSGNVRFEKIQIDQQARRRQRRRVVRRREQIRPLGVAHLLQHPPIHLQPYMVERFGYKGGELPVCEYVSARTLALPFFGGMTYHQVERVCSALERILERMLVARKGRF